MKLIQDLSIGKNIKQLRKERKLTQNELCAKMQLFGSNIGITTLAKIENGYRNIRISDLIILQEIFNVSYDEFFKNLTL